MSVTEEWPEAGFGYFVINGILPPERGELYIEVPYIDVEFVPTQNPEKINKVYLSLGETLLEGAPSFRIDLVKTDGAWKAPRYTLPYPEGHVYAAGGRVRSTGYDLVAFIGNLIHNSEPVRPYFGNYFLEPQWLSLLDYIRGIVTKAPLTGRVESIAAYARALGRKEDKKYEVKLQCAIYDWQTKDLLGTSDIITIYGENKAGWMFFPVPSGVLLKAGKEYYISALAQGARAHLVYLIKPGMGYNANLKSFPETCAGPGWFKSNELFSVYCLIKELQGPLGVWKFPLLNWLR